MAPNKGHNTAPLKKPRYMEPKDAVAPPVTPPKPLSMEEMVNEKEKALLQMQEQLKEQANGVANQLFLIRQLKHPEEFEAHEPPDDPDTGEPAPAPPNDTPDGHI